MLSLRLSGYEKWERWRRHQLQPNKFKRVFLSHSNNERDRFIGALIYEWIKYNKLNNLKKFCVIRPLTSSSPACLVCVRTSVSCVLYRPGLSGNTLPACLMVYYDYYYLSIRIPTNFSSLRRWGGGRSFIHIFVFQFFFIIIITCLYDVS